MSDLSSPVVILIGIIASIIMLAVTYSIGVFAVLILKIKT